MGPNSIISPPSNRGNSVSVEQAVFASRDDPRMRGYHIVAQSEGVCPRMARALVRWSPSHHGLNNDHRTATGLFYFPFDHQVAIGRSLYGTPEFSGRGGLQTVTNYLVTDQEHLAGFQNNAWIMALFARSQGHLRYTPFVSGILPTLSFPAQWQFGTPQDSTGLTGNGVVESLKKTMTMLANHRRVAIIGLQNPAEALRWILCRLGHEQRLQLSFSIGIQPSVQRPFQLLFLDHAGVEIRSDLSADGVAVLQP